ncbi:MAG: FAD-dependent oxidoreductase [Gammaproteobacteria bacterium]|nr:FAD-dependent oxidoreductase [Gammaproteobacteria bacterium]
MSTANSTVNTAKTNANRKNSGSHAEDHHVVIVGANFAGLSAAKRLACKSDMQVTLVDPSKAFHWAPNIHEIVSGLKASTGVSISSEKIARQLGHRFVDDEAVALDINNNEVRLADGELLAYDALLVACGLSASDMGISGAEENCIGMRHAEEAKRIEQRIAVGLAAKRPFAVTIIGAGFTGVELLGELLRKHANNKLLSINVIESAPRVLAGLPSVIGEDIRKQCTGHAVHFYLAKDISAIEKRAVKLQDGSSIDSDLTICCAGTAIPELIRESELACSEQGILVNDELQSKTASNVFAAGDIAATTSSLKKQASFAIDMGKHAAGNIEALLSGQAPRPFIPFQKPMLLSFGDINTYFIYNNSVFASPLLAPLKEAVYQFYMAQFGASLPAAEQGFGLLGRYTRSVKEMLLPELLKFRFAELLGRSKRLQ